MKNCSVLLSLTNVLSERIVGVPTHPFWWQLDSQSYVLKLSYSLYQAVSTICCEVTETTSLNGKVRRDIKIFCQPLANIYLSSVSEEPPPIYKLYLLYILNLINFFETLKVWEHPSAVVYFTIPRYAGETRVRVRVHRCGVYLLPQELFQINRWRTGQPSISSVHRG